MRPPAKFVPVTKKRGVVPMKPKKLRKPTRPADDDMAAREKRVKDFEDANGDQSV